MATVVSEDDVIRKRLAVEGDGGGDDRRVMSLLKMFVRWCDSSQPGGEESEATFQKMLFTLGQCEYSFLKSAAVMDMNLKEMERCERVYGDIEGKLERARRQITELKEGLQRSRIIRRHRQEYDALAKVILKHPARQNSHERIEELQSRLAELKGQHKALEDKMVLRRKQFHLLVHSLHSLHDILSNEDMDTT